jgi:hypothetical protein
LNIVYLPEPESHPLWPEIRSLLEPAARLGGIEPYEPGDVVWLAFEGGKVWAAMVSRLAFDVAEIRCVAGTRLKDWLPQWAAVFEEWARNCEAGLLECRGRKGWGRFADRFGWKFAHVDDDGLPVYQKEL